MSTIQEILSMIISAEDDAQKIVGDAKDQASGVFQLTKDSFEPHRKSKIANARDQAKKIIEEAKALADEHAESILDEAAEEREQIRKRCDERIASLVRSVLLDTVQHIKAGGRAA